MLKIRNQDHSWKWWSQLSSCLSSKTSQSAFSSKDLKMRLNVSVCNRLHRRKPKSWLKGKLHLLLSRKSLEILEKFKQGKISCQQLVKSGHDSFAKWRRAGLAGKFCFMEAGKCAWFPSLSMTGTVRASPSTKTAMPMTRVGAAGTEFLDSLKNYKQLTLFLAI